jgi:hypothetical protein
MAYNQEEGGNDGIKSQLSMINNSTRLEHFKFYKHIHRLFTCTGQSAQPRHS